MLENIPVILGVAARDWPDTTTSAATSNKRTMIYCPVGNPRPESAGRSEPRECLFWRAGLSGISNINSFLVGRLASKPLPNREDNRYPQKATHKESQNSRQMQLANDLRRSGLPQPTSQGGWQQRVKRQLFPGVTTEAE
jgi:hypothetical protein